MASAPRMTNYQYRDGFYLRPEFCVRCGGGGVVDESATGEPRFERVCQACGGGGVVVVETRLPE